MVETHSIEQLENDFWKDMDFPTTLVERCFYYRKIPIGELTPEQLRTLIGQEIGLKYLLPLALKVLRENMILEAQFYEGDLLASVLVIPESFWQRFPATRLEVRQLILDKKQFIEEHNQGSRFRQLLREIDSFLNS